METILLITVFPLLLILNLFISYLYINYKVEETHRYFGDKFLELYGKRFSALETSLHKNNPDAFNVFARVTGELKGSILNVECKIEDIVKEIDKLNKG